MIDEIKIKQNLILSKSEEDEAKRLFIEAILSLLTIGVISLSNNFTINLYNNSVLKILGKDKKDLKNKSFLDVFPELIPPKKEHETTWVNSPSDLSKCKDAELGDSPTL